jgi:hypothetical protein
MKLRMDIIARYSTNQVQAGLFDRLVVKWLRNGSPRQKFRQARRENDS